MEDKGLKSLLKTIAYGIILLGAWESSAQTLINLNTGAKTQVEDLLSQNLLLVYLEKDCAVCAQYIKNLQNCPESDKKKIRYISVSTAAQTKELARKHSVSESMYLVKDRQSLKSVYATPTTMWTGGQKIGALSCQEIANLVSQKHP